MIRRPIILSHRTLLLINVIGIALIVTTAGAAEVRVSVDSRETYVGMPVTLTIAIENAKSFESPQLPEIEGATVQAIPGSNRSSLTQIINGRTTQRITDTVTYNITPTQAGTITIPAFTVTADGQAFSSAAIEIAVTKSETGDLLFIELKSDKPSIYLGQSLTLTLRIWIKSYQDRQYNVRLSGEDTWTLIDLERSSFGDFTEVLLKLRDPFGRIAVNAEESLRIGDDGVKHSYYVYEFQNVVWPQQTGALAIQSPSIVVKYPVRLVRSDDFFSRGLRVAEARPVSATASLPPVEVKAPPQANQPPTFNGAVGQFDIAVTAKPTDVAVGDPITLTMMVTDRSSGGVRLDLLPPPALDRVPELNDNFKMPSDPLAGTVRGSSKVFTQTIRPKNQNVTRIPPIPLTFFDPSSETYVTRSSGPIPISVKPASQLAVNDVIASPGSGSTPAATTELTEVAGGILANYSDIDAMLAQQQFSIGWMGMGALFMPPLMFAGVSIGRLAGRRKGMNGHVQRRRLAKKKALNRIEKVGALPAHDQVQSIAAAVCDYVADRLNLPASTLTRDDVLDLLRARSAVDGDLREIESLLRECEQLVYAGGSDRAAADLAKRAIACVERLERSRLA